MEYTQKVVYQSNYWYNDGLKKAKIRDMTGAVTSLKKSLQFNSENIAARNLLGLVYYGRGEVGEALVEWILSKNLRPKDNIANYYIQKIQKSPADLDTINQAIRKYNQSLRAGRRRYGYHPVKAGSSSISGIPESVSASGIIVSAH